MDDISAKLDDAYKSMQSAKYQRIRAGFNQSARRRPRAVERKPRKTAVRPVEFELDKAVLRIQCTIRRFLAYHKTLKETGLSVQCRQKTQFKSRVMIERQARARIRNSIRSHVLRERIKSGRMQNSMRLRVILPAIPNVTDKKPKEVGPIKEEVLLPKLKRVSLLSRYVTRASERAEDSESDSSVSEYEPPMHKTVNFNQALPSLYNMVKTYGRQAFESFRK